MRAKALGLGLLGGAFALLACGAVVDAAVLTTPPEIESINLSLPLATDPADFQVVRVGDTSPADVTINTPTPVSQALTFNQFNAALGDLTGVTITFGTTYGATATLNVPINNDSVTIDFFADATVNHSLAAAGLITTASSLQAFSATCSADASDTCSNTKSDNGVIFPNPSPGAITVIGSLASFTGNSTFDLTATLSAALAPRISPDNGTNFAADTNFSGALTNANWNGTVSLVYTYTTNEAAVPAPLSLYLVGAGLAGGALWRRYRR